MYYDIRYQSVNRSLLTCCKYRQKHLVGVWLFANTYLMQVLPKYEKVIDYYYCSHCIKIVNITRLSSIFTNRSLLCKYENELLQNLTHTKKFFLSGTNYKLPYVIYLQI